MIGLGNWPSHIAHIRRGTIIEFRDYHNNFPELDNMIIHQFNLNSSSSDDNNIKDSEKKELIAFLKRNMDSPLLLVAEKWLRDDLRELRLLQNEERKKLSQDQDKVLLCEEKPRTKWDDLSENVLVYGDKYYNYWNH